MIEESIEEQKKILNIFNNIKIENNFDKKTKHQENFKKIIYDGSTTGDQLCEAYNLAVFLKKKNMILIKEEKQFSFDEIIDKGKKRTGVWFLWGNRQYQKILNLLYQSEEKKAKLLGEAKVRDDKAENGGIEIVSFINFLIREGFRFSFILVSEKNNLSNSIDEEMTLAEKKQKKRLIRK